MKGHTQHAGQPAAHQERIGVPPAAAKPPLLNGFDAVMLRGQRVLAQQSDGIRVALRSRNDAAVREIRCWLHHRASILWTWRTRGTGSDGPVAQSPDEPDQPGATGELSSQAQDIA